MLFFIKIWGNVLVHKWPDSPFSRTVTLNTQPIKLRTRKSWKGQVKTQNWTHYKTSKSLSTIKEQFWAKMAETVERKGKVYRIYLKRVTDVIAAKMALPKGCEYVQSKILFFLFACLLGGTVAQWYHLPSKSTRVPKSILSLDYSLCWVSYVPPMSV